MAVRNCADLGQNLQKIVQRLMANNELIKYLYYSDKDPLSQPELSTEEKSEEIFEKLIKIVPRVGPKETAKSLISVYISDGFRNRENLEFRDIELVVEVFVPLTQWIMKGTNLRPFAILGEVQKSLDGKTIDGLGKIMGGDFSLNFLTEEISCYKQVFHLVNYD